jgi:putative Holliday junction resolvase
MKIRKKILAVDLGEKNIGLAISDLYGMIAMPLETFQHRNREWDAQHIVEKADSVGASIILIGQALDAEGQIGSAARHAIKVADVVRSFFQGEVLLWDESGSTDAVKKNYVEMGIPRTKRRGHLDASAAAWILQDFLDSQSYQDSFGEKRDQDDS